MAFVNLPLEMNKYQVHPETEPALFGNVLLATDPRTNSKVAIKRVPVDSADNNSPITMERRVNKHVMKLGGHANIVPLRDSFQEDGYDHLVIDYSVKGTLFDVLKATPEKRFSYRESIEYFNQIVEGVAFIRKLGYAHCDLSLETVLVTNNNTCQLTEFGLASDASHKKYNPVGKYFYMAPEMYENRGYDPAVADIWSLGILLFIMLTGVAPFRQARVLDDQFELFKQRGLEALCDQLGVVDLIPNDAFELLDAMLKINPNSRITIKDIVAACDRPEMVVVPRRKNSFFNKVFDPIKAPFRHNKQQRSTF
ncbi:unnamed protein product [Aphanomyces euteiches]